MQVPHKLGFLHLQQLVKRYTKQLLPVRVSKYHRKRRNRMPDTIHWTSTHAEEVDVCEHLRVECLRGGHESSLLRAMGGEDELGMRPGGAGDEGVVEDESRKEALGKRTIAIGNEKKGFECLRI